MDFSFLTNLMGDTSKDASAAIIGAGVGAASTAWANHERRTETRRAEKRAYDTNKAYAINTPAWNRQGLEDAGFNPMLALNSGSSFSQSPSSVSSGAVGDLVGSAKDGAELGRHLREVYNLQASKMKKEIEELDARIDNTKADTEKKGVEKYKDPKGVAIKGLVDYANGEENREVEAFNEATKYFSEKFKGIQQGATDSYERRKELLKFPKEQRDLSKPSLYKMPKGPDRGSYRRYKNRKANDKFRQRYLSRPLFH